ncbi:H-NS histone family protein [Ralstonia insidiosa]|jgi:DNA-binding protein H-NS|uniref:DNA-binding protein n=1 Tax=Ralstonia insidiosa TaxID=190721 RepID=A0A192A7T4_9RALS|nr:MULTISPECIES: H-NS histone family protein [Ralstonia]KMW44777.1 DNA-binding protein [Ralstonia sp. MD27]ANJ76362.1 DNA-binding protein [Ralstonia insidiosa]MBA9869781.1 H-NS histone family protein [Ralstonia insidiosa]MBA9884919.1 H-NS histone family protein [Ralstonia pickettii]MBA9894680.1 H-NS histone family protein [Ralstonia pickettii]
MATYKELMAKKAALDEQIEAARKAEVEQVVQQIRQIMQDYDLTVEDLGVKRVRKAHGKTPVAPKYQDPKTGATWSGRGRAPAWIGKNRDRFLIA